jgi:Na+/H+ antiporter NhaC
MPAMTSNRRRLAACVAFLAIAVACSVCAAQNAASPQAVDASTSAGHRFGWLSLLPPLVAIVLAIVTRRVIPSLIVGVFIGALIAANGNPLPAVYHTLETHLWGAIVDGFHLRVITFTLLMGAMVGLISRAGGMHGLVALLLPLARTRRGGQLVAWALGLVIFFDDYANTVVLGNTARPITDRLRISRQKLAYIVDSTSAPVAGLALVSTWIAVELGYIGEALNDAGLDGGRAYGVFIATIPYRFYVLWALAMVAVVARLGRDFGRMLRAEREALAAGDAALAAPAPQTEAELSPAPSVAQRWINAVAPVAMVVFAFFTILILQGIRNIAGELSLSAVITVLRDASLVQIVSAVKDASPALFYAALLGVIVAFVMVRVQRLLDHRASLAALAAGAKTMLPGVCVLVAAWALVSVVGEDHLQTGPYIASLFEGDDGQPAPWLRWGAKLLPAAVFVVAALTSFATGTSWGTMAILMPIAIKVAHGLLSAEAGGTDASMIDDPVMLATIGSVLAGSIFGDHCSPISDTTVLSSQASGCDHLAHVETQLPYALLVGVLATAGLVLVGFGAPAWAVLIGGLGVIVAVVRFVGRRADEVV